MQKNKDNGLYSIFPGNEVPCQIIKKSKYYNEYMISYMDPELGGVSEAWVHKYKLKWLY